jgi:hypothetical protein
MKKSDTIGNRTRDLPVCSAVPQPLRHRAPHTYCKGSPFVCSAITQASGSVEQLVVLYSGPSSYDRPDIPTTWVTTKILVLTYDQNLELRPHAGQGHLSYDPPAWRS